MDGLQHLLSHIENFNGGPPHRFSNNGVRTNNVAKFLLKDNIGATTHKDLGLVQPLQQSFNHLAFIIHWLETTLTAFTILIFAHWEDVMRPVDALAFLGVNHQNQVWTQVVSISNQVTHRWSQLFRILFFHSGLKITRVPCTGAFPKWLPRTHVKLPVKLVSTIAKTFPRAVPQEATKAVFLATDCHWVRSTCAIIVFSTRPL